jgi:UDP-GlcNAc:undecaprenyl-phosphate/decaprenyl-phosphate GlcNAc-1-phosphate transferase
VPGFGSFLLIGAIAAATTFAITPLVKTLARRQGWVYLPTDRTVHTSPLPDVGGLAMFAGFLVAMAAAWLLDVFDVLFDSNSEPLGVVLAATIVFGVGFIDDIREVSAPAKVAGTVLAGIVLVQFGVVMYSFRIPFYDGPIVLSDDLQPLVTVLWLLGLTQAINLIDGLDGLAAGIVAIAAFSFFLYSQELTENGLLDVANIGPLVAIVAVGVCIGFLPHNFNPARIMMGDGGALFLGLLLAVATSVVGGRTDTFSGEFVGQTYFFLAPLAIPVLILGVPIFDMAFAIVRRVSSRRSFAMADKGHLHHRLMNLGHGHRRSVVILWTWTALLSAFVLYPTLTGRNPVYLPFGIIAAAIVLYTVLHPSVRARRRVISAEPTEDALPVTADSSSANGALGDPVTLTDGVGAEPVDVGALDVTDDSARSRLLGGQGGE